LPSKKGSLLSRAAANNFILVVCSGLFAHNAARSISFAEASKIRSILENLAFSDRYKIGEMKMDGLKRLIATI
jgi:hypothetical protein